MTKPRVVFHLPGHMLDNDGAAMPGLFRKLSSGLRHRGAETELRWRDAEALIRMTETPDVHLVHNGGFTHPRLLNTGLAYVFPYWYCDPIGIFGDSSLVGARFDPTEIDPAKAADFHARLHRRLVIGRQSRYDQPQDRRHFAAGHIALFLQGASDPVDRARYMTEAEMFAAVLAARGPRPVAVKPHPRNTTGDTTAIMALAARTPGVTITDANVHDILASAAVTVTTTSATALESMLHGVPVILCGQSDLHHCAATTRNPGDIAEALREVVARPYPFAAFLYWFLGQNMLNAGSETLVDDLLVRLRHHAIETDELFSGD
ncbi:MAG: hypothetical protein KDE08_14335 [Rhodobacteraceae bacterium]|nr:hypothetical protein [Paracoccaceae bacterium]